MLLLSRKKGKSSKVGEQRGNSSEWKKDVTPLLLSQFGNFQFDSETL